MTGLILKNMLWSVYDQEQQHQNNLHTFSNAKTLRHSQLSWREIIIFNLKNWNKTVLSNCLVTDSFCFSFHLLYTHITLPFSLDLSKKTCISWISTFSVDFRRLLSRLAKVLSVVGFFSFASYLSVPSYFFLIQVWALTLISNLIKSFIP